MRKITDESFLPQIKTTKIPVKKFDDKICF